MALWLFVLDHTNYARRLPVHIRDMVMLETDHPSLYKEFTEDNFVVHKLSNMFSSFAIYQTHEQMNEIIEGRGGAVGLFDGPKALQRWMVAGPEEYTSLCTVMLMSPKSRQSVMKWSPVFRKHFTKI